MLKADAVVGRTVSIHLNERVCKHKYAQILFFLFSFFLKQITFKKKIQFDQSINIFFSETLDFKQEGRIVLVIYGLGSYFCNFGNHFYCLYQHNTLQMQYITEKKSTQETQAVR